MNALCKTFQVDSANLEEYIELVIDATINSGISQQMDAFKSGFNQVRFSLFLFSCCNVYTDEH